MSCLHLEWTGKMDVLMGQVWDDKAVEQVVACSSTTLKDQTPKSRQQQDYTWHGRIRGGSFQVSSSSSVGWLWCSVYANVNVLRLAQEMHLCVCL